MLLNKYGKVNILSKCMIVDGQVDVKQVSQILLS